MQNSRDLSERAGRRLWIGLPGPTLDPATRARLERVRPGGIVLFRRNVVDRAQLISLCRALRALVGASLHIVTDQEGGRVARLIDEATLFPGNMCLGAIEAAAPGRGCELARRAAAITGRELRALGIDVNLAPVADLAAPCGSSVIGTRSFGADPKRTAALVAAAVAGQREGGVHSVLKHFPGIGDGELDPHVDLPALGRTASDDAWLPFAQGIAAGAGLVMTSHAILRHIDPALPATLSTPVLSALRRNLHFEGVILSDDLEMGALRGLGDFDDIVRGAVAVGHDALLICADPGLQLCAHEVLRSGFVRGEPWLGDAAECDARLDRLRSVPPGQGAFGMPEEGRGCDLAQTIADESVTLLRGSTAEWQSAESSGPATLLVLPAPAATPGSPVEDALRGEGLGWLASEMSESVRVLCVSETPGADELVGLERAARGARRVACVLAAPRRSARERGVAQIIAACGKQAAFLLLGDPHDIEVLPGGDPSLVLCAYGARRTQQRALARVLCGALEPRGANPVG